MNKLSWYINRLRLMSVAEILYRLKKTASIKIESTKIRSGWEPLLASNNVRSKPLFENPEAIIESFQTLYPNPPQALDQALAGKVAFFGEVFDVGTLPDWHRDPETGTISPKSYGKTLNYRDPNVVGNIKTLWELNRLQHLLPLAVHHIATGCVESKQMVAAQVESWIKDNEFGKGINWSNSLEVALRGITLTWVDQIICLKEPDTGLDGWIGSQQLLQKTLYQHCHFIRSFISRYSSANNHLFGELVGLWFMSSAFDFGKVSEQWANFAKNEIEAEIQAQVHEDGVLKEQATHYQTEIMEYMLLSFCIGQAVNKPFSTKAHQYLAQMLKFLESLEIDPVGLPQIGDSDEGYVARFDFDNVERPDEQVINAVKCCLFSDQALNCQKAFWYQHLLPSKAAPLLQPTSISPQKNGLSKFAAGGYAVIDANDTKLVMDAGPLGYPSIAAHGHADALSVCLGHASRWWLVDPGTFAYHGDQTFRNYFRGTSAHNTIVVNDTDQSQIAGPFMWTTRAEASFKEEDHSSAALPVESVYGVSGEHDGYKKFNVIHERHVELEASGLSGFIQDHLHRTSNETTNVCIYFHFAPDLEVILDGCSCTATSKGQPTSLNLQLHPSCVWTLHRGETDPILGWYSKGLGHKEECFSLRGACQIKDAQTLTTHFSFET